MATWTGAVLAALLLPTGCSSEPTPQRTHGSPSTTSTEMPSGSAETPSARAQSAPPTRPLIGRSYPVHSGIVATTFWVGEIFDPAAADGSQVISTYDSLWLQHYGGCDGVVASGDCQTEPRTARNGFFPTRMTPLQNPFYLDLPFDDINEPKAFAQRASVIPWAGDPGYIGKAKDPNVSWMKNRWVKITSSGQTCYGQVQDAGPGEYDDFRYVFGKDDRRPANQRYNGAGMDVSPALNGCLRFSELDGEDDRVNWQFVDDVDVPAGPWKRVVTTAGVLS